MRDNRTGRTPICRSALAVVLLAALVMSGACSKKEPPPEQKAGAASPKAGTHNKADHHEGTVRLGADAVRIAGIEVHEVYPEVPADMIAATGTLELNGDRVSRVSPRVAGRCVKVNVSLGDRVRSGQVLAQIDSVEMDHVWSDYMKARARLELAGRNLKREEALFEKKVSPEKDVLKARQELGEAEADMLLAKERFRLLGVDVRQAETATDGTSHTHPLIPVSAPLSGVVIERMVTEGEMVGIDRALFTLADLSMLWLIVDIYERDFGRVRTGMQTKLSIAAFPGKEFRGRISYVGDIVDEKTRTVKARVTIDNKDGLLKPGMFVTASIDSAQDSRAAKVIAVPEEAVFLDGSERYVFVRESEGTFAVRRVSVGPVTTGAKIEVREGLKAGDAVVTKGVFTLKSELKKEALHQDEH